jgi:formate/nitrite transporter FocA (FNT family)
MRRQRRIALWCLTAGVVVLSVISVFWILNPIQSGDKLQRNDDHQTEDLRESVKLLLSSYTDLTGVITAAFGAVAFLVTYQQKERIAVHRAASTFLMMGLVFMTGALILTLLGRESLLTMISRDAIEMTAHPLLYGRWATYILLVGATVLIGVYAVQLASGRATQNLRAEVDANE